MADITRKVVREPSADTAEQYAHRVRLLACIYLALFVASIAGIVVLIQWAKLFVTLSQRSNVETLALLFFLVFFAYFVLLSWRGAVGAMRMAYYSLAGHLGSGGPERKKVAALERRPATHNSVALNYLVEREDSRESFELPIADEFGSMGKLRIEGAALTHLPDYGPASTNVFIFFEHQVNQMLRESGSTRQLNIVEWKTIEDELLDQYLSLTEFARNLERTLAMEEAWPKVVLTDEQCRELEVRLSSICSALRSEAFLPDWEYSAEHKLPLIPEPLGLLSLGHAEKRVDPVSSMGMATAIVTFSVLVFLMFAVSPPWVPGT